MSKATRVMWDRLSADKAPHVFVGIDEQPKAPTGKILKRAIARGAVRARADRLAARVGR